MGIEHGMECCAGSKGENTERNDPFGSFVLFLYCSCFVLDV